MSFLVFFAIILKGKRELVALLSLSSWCIAAIDILWFFLTVHCVGIQCVITAFPDHTYMPFTYHQSVVIGRFANLYNCADEIQLALFQHKGDIQLSLINMWKICIFHS